MSSSHRAGIGWTVRLFGSGGGVHTSLPRDYPLLQCGHVDSFAMPRAGAVVAIERVHAGAWMTSTSWKQCSLPKAASIGIRSFKRRAQKEQGDEESTPRVLLSHTARGATTLIQPTRLFFVFIQCILRNVFLKLFLWMNKIFLNREIM